MRRKWVIAVGAAAVLTLAAALAMRASETALENGRPGAGETVSAEESSGGTERGDDEKTALGKCEHDEARYLCEECRYEAGVVKVADSIVCDGTTTGLIRTARVVMLNIAATVEVTGEIQLNQNATARLGSAIPGILQSVRTDLGMRVKKGDLLFIIHSAELGRVMSEYRRNLSLTRLSEKNFAREKSLFERKISSELDMTEKEMEYEKNRADLEASEQTLRALGLTAADISAARDDSRDGASAGLLPIRAPFDGTIIEKNASIGELIEPGKAVVILSDPSTLWVWADVYEKDLPWLLEARKKGGIPISVRTNAFPDHSFHCVIDYIGATVNEGTRTVKVRATLKNDDLLLRAGMFCNIIMGAGSTGSQALVVPRNALLSDEGNDFVFAKWKDGYFVRRPVKKGLELPDSFQILEGLQPGETIISDGAFLLKSDVLREKMGAGCAD